MFKWKLNRVNIAVNATSKMGPYPNWDNQASVHILLYPKLNIYDLYAQMRLLDLNPIFCPA
uniref:Uncharacterized protein n=1 Tax=Sus scrofa TaxID=9823 RepID=Q6YSS8_PIG|nr:hypothetical protein [Sus scrofa]